MNTNRLLIGGIVGGIAFFLLGWVIYGMLLKTQMDEAMSLAASLKRGDDAMIWWAMILGNMAAGFLLAYIFEKSGVLTVAGGATTGAVVGLLIAISMDFMMYSMMNMITMQGIWIDIIASTVMYCIAGAIIGFVMGRLNRSAA